MEIRGPIGIRNPKIQDTQNLPVKEKAKDTKSTADKTLDTIKKTVTKSNKKPPFTKYTISNKKITDYFGSTKVQHKSLKRKSSSDKSISLLKSLSESCLDPNYKQNEKENCIAKSRKRKFCTPAVSQLEDVRYSYDINLLKDSTVIELVDKLLHGGPVKIGLNLIFGQECCQLSRSSNCKKDLVPTGLLFCVYWNIDDEPDYFYTSRFASWFSADTSRALILTLMSSQVSCPKVCYNGQQLFVYLMKTFGIEEYQVSVGWEVWDVMIGCWLLDPDQPSASFGGARGILRVDSKKQVLTDSAETKGCYMLKLLSQCAESMCDMLRVKKLWDVFVNIEMKIVPLLAVMESKGILVDETQLAETKTVLKKRLDEIQTEAYEAAGQPFRLNSAVQLRKIMYDTLNLDKKCEIKIKETATLREKSTSEPMLLALKSVHPLPQLVLEYRHLHKAKTAHVDSIIKYTSNGIIRPKWQQTGASTGRISCSNPNLQAIPKRELPLVLFPLEEGANVQRINLRSPYISRQGFCLVSADFCHIEFRVYAHLAQDKELIQIFKKPGDLFVSLGKLIIGNESAEISAEDRERTKKIVYAIIYGAGVGKLSEILQVEVGEAAKILRMFSGKFRAFRDFAKGLVETAKKQGYLCSLSGRRRLFPNIKSTNQKLRKQAERQAINFVIQGSAADICKAVMVATEKSLRQKYGTEYCLLLQIHDELVWEVQEQHMKAVIDDLKNLLNDTNQICSDFCQLSVPLPVALFVGKRWGDMRECSMY